MSIISYLKKKPLSVLYFFGLVLLLAGGWLWWARIDTNPERVFWESIERGMATSGVTSVAEQDNGGTTIHQTSQYSLGATNTVHTLTHLTQGATTVRNEMIGTPTTDYSRYVSIKTDQKKTDGSPLDVSSIIGVWAKGQEGSAQLFQQAVLGSTLPLGGATVPIGNLSGETRDRLVAQLRKDGAYKVSFNKVKKEQKDGRLLYTYDVKIQPMPYAALIKQLTKDIGVHGLEELDPAQYKNEEPLSLQLVVDVRARHVVRAQMPEAGYSQSFTSYDVPVRVDLPKQAISGAELQKRLQSLQ